MSNLLLIGKPGSGKCKLLESIVDKFENVVWVTTLSSAEFVRRRIENENLWIVDTFTWVKRETQTEKDIVVKNPLNLNEISLAIGKILDSIEGEYILILNPISGLLIYHSFQRLFHFLRTIFVRMETEGGSGAFTLVKDAHEKNLEISISMLFPNIFELEENSKIRIVKSEVPFDKNYINNRELEKKIVEILKLK